MKDSVKVISYPSFAARYDTQRAMFAPKKGQAKATSLWVSVALLVGLLAANVLSASHTIPTVRITIPYELGDTVRTLIAFSAFFAIDFMLVTLMIIPAAGKLRNTVLSLALTVAIVANVYSSMAAVGENNLFASFIGLVLGLFAPLANLAIGELFRSINLKREQAIAEVEAQYLTDQHTWDVKRREMYGRYLTKLGITDKAQPTLRALLMSGETVMDDLIDLTDLTEKPDTSDLSGATEVPAMDTPEPPQKRTVTRVARKTGNSKAEEIAKDLVSRRRIDWTYAQIQETYQTSPNTAAKVRKLLREWGHIE